jgi:hypothetical protein
MNALRIRKHLNAPIAELPELTPMVGKDVEIIVIDESDAAVRRVGPEPTNVPGGAPPIESIECLRSDIPDDPFGPDFERIIQEWRREPWRPHDPLEEPGIG